MITLVFVLFMLVLGIFAGQSSKRAAALHAEPGLIQGAGI